MTRREYVAGRPTTLDGPFNIGATQFTIANDGSADTWPTSATYDFFVTIDAGTAQEERVLCSARSGRLITVADSGRGKDGTGEKNHAAGATVWPSWSAQDADEANAHIESTGYASFSKSVHGLGSGDGVVVGTSKAQTLTGKTISSADNTMTIAQSAVTNLVSDLAAKAPLANPTFTGTVALPSTTSIGNANSTEIGYLDGVTSAIQTQIDGKSGTGHGHDYAASGHGHAYLPLSGGNLTGTLSSDATFLPTSPNSGSAGAIVLRQNASGGRVYIQFVNNGNSAQFSTIDSSDSGDLTLSSNTAKWNAVYNDVLTGGTANVASTSDGRLRRVSSSAKYKKDIETLEHEVADRVLELRPVWYRAKENNTDNPVDWSYVGLIAEEVAEIEPRLVFYKTVEVGVDENGNETFETLETPVPEGVNYDKITTYLVDIIKREKARSDALEQRLIAIEAQLNSL